MSVKITARAMVYNRHTSRGLIASIYWRDIVRKDSYIGDYHIPLSDQVSTVTSPIINDLETGKYLLQLVLPDGRVITQNFEVNDDENTELVIELPHDGPHEWSTLQAMTGEFANDLLMARGAGESFNPGPSRYTTLRNEPERGYSLAMLTPDETPAGDVFKAGQTLSRFSTLINDDLDVDSATQSLGISHPVTRASLDDDDFALFRFGHSGLLTGKNEDPEGFYMGPGTQLKRNYLLQQSRHGAQLICLPTPWMTADGQASVEMLVKTHSMQDELDFSMTIDDPMVNSALGYINSGAVHLAQRLIDAELARKMLFNKVSYPFTATIGGYILVLGRSTKQYRSNASRWKNWIANLDEWFDWLPDGAVLHTTMCLLDSQPDLDRARDALQRACARGLPIFTFGLKYMMDGLRYFVGLGEDWAEESLQTLQPIANRADPGVPFLTVSYSTHWPHKQVPPGHAYA